MTPVLWASLAISCLSICISLRAMWIDRQTSRSIRQMREKIASHIPGVK